MYFRDIVWNACRRVFWILFPQNINCLAKEILARTPHQQPTYFPVQHFFWGNKTIGAHCTDTFIVVDFWWYFPCSKMWLICMPQQQWLLQVHKRSAYHKIPIIPSYASPLLYHNKKNFLEENNSYSTTKQLLIFFFALDKKNSTHEPIFSFSKCLDSRFAPFLPLPGNLPLWFLNVCAVPTVESRQNSNDKITYISIVVHPFQISIFSLWAYLNPLT